MSLGDDIDISETVQKVLQELIVPYLGKIKEKHSKILAILDLTNKRLDDMNMHLVDQSRRIDVMNKQIDEVRAEFTKRFNDTDKRIDDIRAELTLRFDKIHSDLINSLDANNARIGRFLRPPLPSTNTERWRSA